MIVYYFSLGYEIVIEVRKIPWRNDKNNIVMYIIFISPLHITGFSGSIFIYFNRKNLIIETGHIRMTKYSLCLIQLYKPHLKYCSKLKRKIHLVYIPLVQLNFSLCPFHC